MQAHLYCLGLSYTLHCTCETGMQTIGHFLQLCPFCQKSPSSALAGGSYTGKQTLGCKERSPKECIIYQAINRDICVVFFVCVYLYWLTIKAEWKLVSEHIQLFKYSQSASIFKSHSSNHLKPDWPSNNTGLFSLIHGTLKNVYSQIKQNYLLWGLCEGIR